MDNAVRGIEIRKVTKQSRNKVKQGQGENDSYRRKPRKIVKPINTAPK